MTHFFPYKKNNKKTAQTLPSCGWSFLSRRWRSSVPSKEMPLFFTAWWLNQPIWKICSSKWNGIISPRIGVKITHICFATTHFTVLKKSRYQQKVGKRHGMTGMTFFARSFVVSTSWVSQVDTLKKTWQYFGRWRAISLSRMHNWVFFAPDTDVDRS